MTSSPALRQLDEGGEASSREATFELYMFKTLKCIIDSVLCVMVSYFQISESRFFFRHQIWCNSFRIQENEIIDGTGRSRLKTQIPAGNKVGGKKSKQEDRFGVWSCYNIFTTVANNADLLKHTSVLYEG